MTRKSFGWHAIVNIKGDISQYNGEKLAATMKEAALAGKATILNTKIHSFGEGMGFTGVLMLAESHISVHTWPEDDYAAFDIFMCSSKEDVIKAANLIIETDNYKDVDINYLERKI